MVFLDSPNIIKVIFLGVVGQEGHQVCYFLWKLLLQLFQRNVRVLHYIVEQRGACGGLPFHLLCQVGGVENIRDAAGVFLPVVGLVGNFHGFFG